MVVKLIQVLLYNTIQDLKVFVYTADNVEGYLKVLYTRLFN